MKKYVQLQCSTCKRERDELVDVTHYTTDNCTITLGCEGRLSPVGFTNEGSNNVSIPPTGLSNWYPRGTITTTTDTKPDLIYSVSTGEKQQLFLAVHRTIDPEYIPGDDSFIMLNLTTEQQSARDFRQYVYRRQGSVQIVNGVEDGQAKKVLRYSFNSAQPDQVEVYVNGVKRTRGFGEDEYQLFDGIDSSAPPNSVFFNSMITSASTQVDVIVTKAATLSTAQIKLTRAIDDESRIGTGAWEGVNSVDTVEGRWFLFYCDISELTPLLPLDVRLRLSAETPSTITDGPDISEITDPTPPSSGMFRMSFAIGSKVHASILLSRENLYTPLDRQRSNWVPLTNLTTNTGYLVVKLVGNVRTLFVSEPAISTVFPSLTVNRFDPPILMRSGLLGNNDASELNNEFVIGPDS